MSMLLTISQPAKTEFGGRMTHDFSPRISLAKSRLSPQPRAERVDSPVSSLRASVPADNMTSSHRGLPPPANMTLPDPGRPPHQLNQPLGALPTPPQWQGQEESMRSWLAAKAEEEKRKAEEEKTKQEGFKLDQRRIEQQMLRDALNSGIPPTMIPMIYAGLGGAHLASISTEFLTNYTATLQAATQHYQQVPASPDYRREPRLLGPGQGVGLPGAAQQVLPSQHGEQPQPPMQSNFQSYQPGPYRPHPTSAPRSATHQKLPKLTTNEMYVHQPNQQGPGSAHPLQQSQTIQQEGAASSPTVGANLYFHHWVPPNESKSNMPQTPASKGEPHSAHPSSHLSESDYRESPRKRKAQGPHQPAPMPSQGPPNTSPSFSVTSSYSGRKADRRESAESRPVSRRELEVPRLAQADSGETSEDRVERSQRDSSPPPLRQEESTEQSSAEMPPRELRSERPESRG